MKNLNYSFGEEREQNEDQSNFFMNSSFKNFEFETKEEESQLGTDILF